MLIYSTLEHIVRKLATGEMPDRICASPRVGDEWGAGHYHAPRGSRKHNGIDLLIPAGSIIYAPCDGIITKHGLCYRGDEYRYIEIKDNMDNRVRLFYTQPCSSIGDSVRKGTPIAYMQELGIRHHADEDHKHPMPNHCHLEILRGRVPQKEYINPTLYDFI